MTTFPDFLKVDPDNFDLKSIDTNQPVAWDGGDLDRDDAEKVYKKNIKRLQELQYKMWAERKQNMLVVIQAMDTGGKDGAIRKVFGPLNPQGVKTTAFKVPTEKEAAHDFLWRIHKHAPQRGMIQVFNRSHYEDVLVVRVHNYKPEPVWRTHYDHINNWEQLLVDTNDTVIVKIMLHISKDEQKARLQERLDDPERHWKFSSGDLKERKLWDDYMEAFQEALVKTSKPHAPWYVIPADKKWFRNYAISSIVLSVMESIDLNWPEAEDGLHDIVID